MTETADTAAPTRPAKGLTIERIFTTEGVHPYDAVTWESRDVVQQNWKTGETIFEQRGVESDAPRGTVDVTVASRDRRGFGDDPAQRPPRVGHQPRMLGEQADIPGPPPVSAITRS